MDKNDEIKLQQIISDWFQFAQKELKTSYSRETDLKFSKDLATALIGVRRSGKTTLAIQEVFKISQKVLYINFEDPYFNENSNFEILDRLISAYTMLHNHNPDFVLFDEIHNIQGWERWVRKFLDQKKAKLVVTGSSAKMLSSELSTALTGRNITTEVWPLNFIEYLDFKKSKPKKELKFHFNDFLKWGGFPRIVIEEDETLRTNLLRQYYSDTLLKDVVRRNEIRDVDSLLRVFNYYLANIASKSSYNKVKNAFNLSTHAPIHYTRALSEAYLIFEVEIFSRNLKVRHRQPKKIYTIDTGFRQANATHGNKDRGRLLENAVFLELRKRGQSVYYHQDQFECDFVITEQHHPFAVIQVTESMSTESIRERELAGLREAMTQYKLSEGLILTLDEEATLKVKEGSIKILPAWKYFS